MNLNKALADAVARTVCRDLLDVSTRSCFAQRDFDVDDAADLDKRAPITGHCLSKTTDAVFDLSKKQWGLHFIWVLVVNGFVGSALRGQT